MRVRLNVATKAIETHRRFLAVSGLAAFVAGRLFLGLGWHVYSIRRVEAQLRRRSEETRKKMAVLQVQRADLDRFFKLPENEKLNERASYLNTLIDARSFNWTQMFMDLERILPGGVRIVSIEPKQNKGRIEVKLTVGANDDEAKVKFLRAIEESKQFKNITLEKDSLPDRANNSGQKLLQLTAEYSRT
jgi:type IV pilus assembly protein PilN